MYLTIVICLACLFVVLVPFLIWVCWFVNSAIYGADGVRMVNFKVTPMTRLFARRPTCRLVLG